ncbi:MAG: M20 family metallopeptidase [Clostridia bacterium]
MEKYLELKEKIAQAVKENLQDAIALNDDLADHPELSGEEYESSRKIVELLKHKGFDVEYPFAGLPTSFKATYGRNDHKYKVAIMTEYDALPGIGHACGHCVSGAISVLAGIAASKLQDALDADIDVIGTPVEETDGAKCALIKKGVFDHYDMAMMIHLYDQNLIYCTLNGLASYLYTFHGKAAHASAAPWDGINALNAAQLMFHGTDCLRQHVTPDVRIHGVIRNGGEAPNIVPEEASAEFYVRALDLDYMMDVVRKVDDCAAGGALATQCTWDKVETAATYANMRRNYTGEDALREIYEELDIDINGDHEKIFGSSDAGNVSFVCPTFHPTLQIVDRGVPIHTREFAQAVKTERAHEAIALGANVIALQIAKIFSDENKIKQMKADFEALGGRKIL